MKNIFFLIYIQSAHHKLFLASKKKWLQFDFNVDFFHASPPSTSVLILSSNHFLCGRLASCCLYFVRLNVMYLRFTLASSGSQSALRLPFISNGQGGEEEAGAENRGRGGEKPIYISEVANVPSWTRYSKRKCFSSDEYQQLHHLQSKIPVSNHALDYF